MSRAPAIQATSQLAMRTPFQLIQFFSPQHLTAVKCVYVHGPCAFTASEDGTVHIYDLETNSLVKQISAIRIPSWLLGAHPDTSSEVLSTIKSKTEYLNHVTLITGNEDARELSSDLYEDRIDSRRSLVCIRDCTLRPRPPYHIFTLPGQGLKTITCMDAYGDSIVCESTKGELVHFQLPNLEALSKASEQ
uniref:Uncharacterized protein n=1 Tax=Daphnia galeata TaxID=27404 RepID=A0A8J2RJZ0_9CRUS|nr:unnamed protein product [Daphnia galeata]